MTTSELIKRLAAEGAPIRRLRPPWQRTARWLILSLPAVAAVHLAGREVLGRIDIRMAVEQAAILLTGLTAALAAFSTAVPGRNWRISLVPLAPLGVWLGSLGVGCVRDWLRFGADGLRVGSGWECAKATGILGIPCTITMVVMLRSGAPLFPRVTLALGALASAALVNFSLRLFHAGDVAVMVLVWHFGGIAVITVLAGRFGGNVLNWRSDVARTYVAPSPRTAF